MNSFIQSDASETETSDFKNFKLGHFKFRTAVLAIGAVGAVMISLVLTSVATTSGDHRTEAVGGGATVQKSPGRCRVPTDPTAFTM